MVTVSIKKLNKWGVALFIFIIATFLAHLEILENDFKLPDNYLFPFPAFAINAFYIVTGLFFFQTLIEYLDQKIPWTNGVTKRFVFQLIISLVIYFIFQSIILYGIEPILNQNQGTSIRILFTFIIGAILAIVLNLISLLFYFQQKTVAQTADLSDFLQGTHKGKKVVIPKTSFLLFHIEEGIVFGSSQDQQKVILKESLAELEKIVGPTHFFRANRKELIAKKAIKQVAFGEGGTTQVSLKNLEKEILISRRRTALFRKWLKEK